MSEYARDLKYYEWRRTLTVPERMAHYLDIIEALASERIRDAFAAIDRTDFLPAEAMSAPLLDMPVSIGEGQTNSQPSTVAKMLEWLKPAPGHKVLDVGAGSGWTTALLAHLVTESGQVIGVERKPSLVEFGQQNLDKYRFPQAYIEQAEQNPGWSREAPYDRIVVSADLAQAPGVMKLLLTQLKGGGRLVASVDNDIVVTETDQSGQVKMSGRHEGFHFVPFVDDRL